MPFLSRWRLSTATGADRSSKPNHPAEPNQACDARHHLIGCPTQYQLIVKPDPTSLGGNRRRSSGSQRFHFAISRFWHQGGSKCRHEDEVPDPLFRGRISGHVEPVPRGSPENEGWTSCRAGARLPAMRRKGTLLAVLVLTVGFGTAGISGVAAAQTQRLPQVPRIKADSTWSYLEPDTNGDPCAVLYFSTHHQFSGSAGVGLTIAGTWTKTSATATLTFDQTLTGTLIGTYVRHFGYTISNRFDLLPGQVCTPQPP